MEDWFVSLRSETGAFLYVVDTGGTGICHIIFAPFGGTCDGELVCDATASIGYEYISLL
jgi:hypothetical protein